MEFLELIKKNRSYRSFNESVKLDGQTLLSFIECARLSASAANRQPLKYYISFDSKDNALIQPLTAWAAKLRPNRILPDKGHYPTSFIIICVDTEIQPSVQSADRDIGIAFDKKIKSALTLPESIEPALIIALGKPDEKIILEDAVDSIDYYRDETDVHHVPKRRLMDIVINGDHDA